MDSLIRIPWDRHRKALCSWGQQGPWRTLSYTSKLGTLPCLLGTKPPHGWEWGNCGCAGQRLQSLFFSEALSWYLHYLNVCFYGLSCTGFLRCPCLWVGSNLHGMLGSCGKPRDKHGPASCGPAWLLPGAQPLQKLSHCHGAPSASGWHVSGWGYVTNLKKLAGLYQSLKMEDSLAFKSIAHWWKRTVAHGCTCNNKFSIKIRVYHSLWGQTELGFDYSSFRHEKMTCLFFQGLSVVLTKYVSLTTNFKTLQWE